MLLYYPIPTVPPAYRFAFETIPAGLLVARALVDRMTLPLAAAAGFDSLLRQSRLLAAFFALQLHHGLLLRHALVAGSGQMEQ